MSVRSSLLWDKVYPLSLRDVTVATVLGLSTLGFFWATQRWVSSLTRYERSLIESFEESDYITQHVSYVTIDSQPIRIFYMQHSLVSKLPKPSPLIVFIHGLGAQINQFEPLLKYFSQVADVLALDLPGCGRSPLVNRDWNFYTTEALATLVGKVIDLRLGGRKCILVGHSLGCFIAGRLALKLEEKCLAVVLLCPKAQISEKEKKGLRFMTSLPEFVFNILRKQDRRGGIHSPSVKRMVGPTVTDRIRSQQLIWNLQSQTPTTLRMLRGAKALTPKEWESIRVPILIISGEEDKVCPSTDGEKIRSWVTSEGSPDMFIVPNAGHAIMIEAGEIVCDVINDFFVKLDLHLSHAWQLAYTAEDKWSLKNKEKWMMIQSVSDLIGTSPLRAMKTLRQTDEHHSPFHLIRLFPKVRHVVDISHGVDAAYDPLSFQNTPITYHKLPTAAKVPPTEEDVVAFIALVKKCLEASRVQGYDDAEICVHCHYGFNRTGFVICCWLIEEEGYGVKAALEAFRVARPNGIRHVHFISTLHRRYPDQL